jgi:SAM-dependent methyltransferase
MAAQAGSYAMDDQRRMSRARNYFAWQGRLVLAEIGPRVIEVGCGVGNFTGMLLDREMVVAVDNRQECVDQLKMRYQGASNVHAFRSSAADDEFLTLAKFRPDSCVCLNVLEHIADDDAALQRMGEVVVPGGVVVLLVPAFAALYGPIDKNLGHYRRYAARSLRRLGQDAGLRLRRIRYLNALGFIGWWANSHVFAREAQSEKQIEIFDRYLVPLLSRIETLAPPPFGQSLFAVFQKP